MALIKQFLRRPPNRFLHSKPFPFSLVFALMTSMLPSARLCLRRSFSTSTTSPISRLLDAVFQKHLSTRRYLRLCARIAAKATVKRIMRRFIPVCDTCRVRPAETCSAQKQDNFAAWVYKHQQWPKAGEGKWKDVRPSCIEKKTRFKANT